MQTRASHVESRVELTPIAAAKLKEICLDEGAEPTVRLYIAGRTCCGFHYGLSIGEVFRADDTVIEQGGVRLVLDALSHEHCADARVDFIDTGRGAGFIVNVPGAPDGCVCGGHGPAV